MRARRLLPDEVGAAHAIVAACGRALVALGHRNWDPPIALDKMRADATNGEVWIVEVQGAPVATFTLASTPPKPCPREIFDPDVPALYVNRLAVVPSRWRGGLGTARLPRVEPLAPRPRVRLPPPRLLSRNAL